MVLCFLLLYIFQVLHTVMHFKRSLLCMKKLQDFLYFLQIFREIIFTKNFVKMILRKNLKIKAPSSFIGEHYSMYLVHFSCRSIFYYLGAQIKLHFYKSMIPLLEVLILRLFLFAAFLQFFFSSSFLQFFFICHHYFQFTIYNTEDVS